MKFLPTLTLITAASLLLAGCGLSANRDPVSGPAMAFTAAALTLDAQLAQDLPSPSTPTAIPATAAPATEPAPTATLAPPQTAASTPQATLPSSPTAPCDAAKFVADVTIPDHSPISPGESFTKTWRLANVGSCTWDSSYTLVFDAGDQMGAPSSQPLPGAVAPGAQTDVSVTFKAPTAGGNYRSFWRLRNPSGLLLPVSSGYKEKSFYVDIQVTNSASQPAFTVTGVTFKVSHSGSCASGTYTVTAKITTNGSGDVRYEWRRSDGVSDTLSNGSVTFSASGSQTISYDWASAATGLSMTLYIDSPNQDGFGPALLNCP
jgi:hypothetical protein